MFIVTRRRIVEEGGVSIAVLTARAIGIGIGLHLSCARSLSMIEFRNLENWERWICAELVADVRVVAGRHLAALIADATPISPIGLAARAILRALLAGTLIGALCLGVSSLARSEPSAAPTTENAMVDTDPQNWTFSQCEGLAIERATLPEDELARYFDRCGQLDVRIAIPKAVLHAHKAQRGMAPRPSWAAARRFLAKYGLEELEAEVAIQSPRVGEDPKRILERLHEIDR